MPIVKAGPFDVDYVEAGTGPTVLLLHSSAAGNRQWRKLMDERAAKNRLIAVNLFGYGATSPWPGDRPATIDDPANLVMALAHFVPEPFTLVGHSLGGAAAAAAALRLGERVNKLILFEPILFYLLQRHGETKAFAEIDAVRRKFNELAAKHDWDAAGRHFVDYRGGHGAWDGMDDERRGRILRILPPIAHEWSMIAAGGPAVEDWAKMKAPVHFIHASDTRLPARALAALMQREVPSWKFHEIAAGGHTAPITRPDLVNPLIGKILDGTA
jgi:pimeloyl-ACP methyl ester carboxylesterase